MPTLVVGMMKTRKIPKHTHDKRGHGTRYRAKPQAAIHPSHFILFSSMHLRLGTRGSALARWQANWVAEQLRARGAEVELVLISTTGDRRLESLATFGGQGVFTKEIQQALLENRIDVAVHSLKDLPTEQPPELCFAATAQRAACGDVLVSPKFGTLDKLPEHATVGTSSHRRQAQLLHVRPDLLIREIRGNVDTRLKKVHAGEYDAIVLAEAGVTRLGLAAEITHRLPFELLLPAVGQGALAIETRQDDDTTRNVVSVLDHAATHAAVSAERAMLAALRGGCLAPIAAWGRLENDRLLLTGRVISLDGRIQLDAQSAADPSDSLALGRRVADELLDQGAAEVIQAAREV
jgi:hydroxymethylbilane synthase